MIKKNYNTYIGKKINHFTIISIINKNGFNIKEILLLESKKYNNFKDRLFQYNGVEKNLLQWSKDSICKISYNILSKRIKSNWIFEEALLTPLIKSNIK